MFFFLIKWPFSSQQIYHICYTSIFFKYHLSTNYSQVEEWTTTTLLRYVKYLRRHWKGFLPFWETETDYRVLFSTQYSCKVNLKYILSDRISECAGPFPFKAHLRTSCTLLANEMVLAGHFHPKKYNDRFEIQLISVQQRLHDMSSVWKL